MTKNMINWSAAGRSRIANLALGISLLVSGVIAFLPSSASALNTCRSFWGSTESYGDYASVSPQYTVPTTCGSTQDIYVSNITDNTQHNTHCAYFGVTLYPTSGGSIDEGTVWACSNSPLIFSRVRTIVLNMPTPRVTHGAIALK